MAITASIYMVVIIALERQRAINSPFKKTPSFAVCSLFLLFLSIAVNLSKFLEFQVRKAQKWNISLMCMFSDFCCEWESGPDSYAASGE